MTVLALIILSVLVMVAASARLIRANRIFIRAAAELKAMAQRPRDLAAQRAALEKALRNATDVTAGSIRRIEALKLERDELTAQLETLRSRRKDDLHALERIMQPGLELFEVEITNAGGFEHLADPAFKLSWASGRTYLVAASSDRDARRRAELKYLGSQGYRTGRVIGSARF